MNEDLVDKEENRIKTIRLLEAATRQMKFSGNFSGDICRNLRAMLDKLDPQPKSDGPSCPRCGQDYTQFSGCACGR